MYPQLGYSRKNRLEILERRRKKRDIYGNEFRVVHRVLGYHIKDRYAQTLDGEYIDKESGAVMPFDLVAEPIFSDTYEELLGGQGLNVRYTKIRRKEKSAD